MLRLIVAENPLLKSPMRGFAHAGLLPPSVWKRLPVEGAFRVMLPDGNSFIYSATANDGIARALFWRGLKSWERETIPVFYKLAKLASLVIDVGANSGVYTMLACAANPHANVVAYEPVPRVYQKLIENIKLNKWENSCKACNVAISNGIGVAKFHVPYGDMPSSASLSSEGYKGCRGMLIDVPVTTLDKDFGNKQVDLVKIDVEGHEDKVLEGMQQILAASAPALIIECTQDGRFQAIQDILNGFNYRFYHLRKSGPAPVTKITPHERDKERNFLCVSRLKKLKFLQ